MSAPTPSPPPALGDALFHKAIAVRTQLQLHEAEIALHSTRAALARAHYDALAVGLGALEAECLAALGAPPGARFNWQTLTADDAPSSPSSPSSSSSAPAPAWQGGPS